MAAMLHFTSGRDGFKSLTPTIHPCSCSYLILRSSRTAIQERIHLERTGEFAAAETAVRYNEIVASLPDDEARVVLLSNLVGARRGQYAAGVFITWVPPRARLRSRMLLAGARGEIEAHARSSGVQVDIWVRICTGIRTDLDLETVLERVHEQQRLEEKVSDLPSPPRTGTGTGTGHGQGATEAGVDGASSTHFIDASAAPGGEFMAPEATTARSDAIDGGALPIVVVLLLFAFSFGVALVVWRVQVAPVLAVRNLAPQPIRMALTLWEWFSATLTDEKASEL